MALSHRSGFTAFYGGVRKALGVLLSGRIKVDSELFNWIACVAYAMVAGLIVRIMIMPTGMLAQSLFTERLLACVIALLAFYTCRRNLFIAVSAGVITLITVNHARALG